MPKIVHNIKIGDKFYYLEIIKILPHSRVICECQCGNKKEFDYYSIIRKDINKATKSCGCYRKINTPKGKDSQYYSHGMSGTRIHQTWINIRRKCRDPNDSHYKWYGAKGIKVCDEWDDFKRFLEWAQSSGYQDNLTIERKNNLKDYCPENCTWIPNTEQSKNRTSNSLITIWEETKILSDWSRDKRCVVSKTCLFNRIHRV